MWERARLRLSREAHDSGMFSSVDSYGPCDLESLLPDFWSAHQEFIRTNQRGFGYWIWKPALISRSLSSLTKSESGIVYLDAGCSLNLARLESRNRLVEYMDIAQDSGGLFFRLAEGNIHERFTKLEVLNFFNAKPLAENRLFAATAFLLSRGEPQVDFADSWLSYLTHENYRLAIGSTDKGGEAHNFVEHRHDQSVLSLMLEDSSYAWLEDETYFSPDWNRRGAGFPIWASRNKSAFRFAGDRFIGKTIRYLEGKAVGLVE